MRHLIYFFVIIILSFTVNAQFKPKSPLLESDKKQTFTSISAADVKKSDSKISTIAIELNNQGVKNMLVENNYEKAISLFQRAVDIDAGCFICRYNLEMAFLNTKNLDQAIEIFTPLTKQKPDYGKAFAGFGEALSQKGRYAEAVSKKCKIK